MNKRDYKIARFKKDEIIIQTTNSPGNLENTFNYEYDYYIFYLFNLKSSRNGKGCHAK